MAGNIISIDDVKKALKLKYGHAVYPDGARKIKAGHVIDITRFEKRDLPDGYAQVEYIESTGTQYINTGFTPNQSTRVVIDVDMAAATSTKGIFGCRSSGSSNGFCVWQASGNKLLSYYGTEYVEMPVTSTGGRFLIEKNGAETTVNGDFYTMNAQTFTAPGPIYLFTVQDAGSSFAYPHSAGKLYSCKIFNDGALARDYIPCINTDGVVGLYDVVTSTFYANAGSGAFTAGDEYGKFARKIFSGSIEVTYTGAHTVKQITKGGILYNLYTLTGSGTLTVSEPVQAWICGGGGNGNSGTLSNTVLAGGGGSGGFVKSGNLSAGSYVVTVASRGGTTTIIQNGTTKLSAAGGSNSTTMHDGGNGGSGGGAGYRRSYNYGSAGTGASTSTYPFGLTALYAHCAGGAGGNLRGDQQYSGRDGGTNGSAGTTTANATGGVRGGGNGGTYTGSSTTPNTNGGNASFYGSGGGGGGVYYYYGISTQGVTTGGVGYQGVAYLLVPA